MTANLKKFIEYVVTDPELAKKLTTTKMDEIEKKKKLAIEIAKEKGFELSTNDFDEIVEVSKDEAKKIAGGYEEPFVDEFEEPNNLKGFFIVPVFFVANANIVANVNFSANVNVDANANVNFNANVHTNANTYDD